MRLPEEKDGELNRGMMGAFSSRSVVPPSLNNSSLSTMPDSAPLDPFQVQLELPPLPTLTSSLLVDPDNKRMGEQLVTKTFFSQHNSKRDQIPTKTKDKSRVFEVAKSGSVHVNKPEKESQSPKEKRVSKLLKKQ